MEIKPSLALAIAFVFLLVGGSAAWFTQKGMLPTGPGDVGIDQQGKLYAHYGVKVFVFDANALPAGSFDLASIGAVGLWGGLSFFPNGDWLVAPEGTEQDGRLHRCTTAGSLSCAPLPALERRFGRTFRTALASETQFYLSASGANSLTVHGSNGEETASFKEPLDRPGEVKRYGDKLAVADVFGLRLKVFDLDPATGLGTGELLSFKTPGQGVKDRAIHKPVDFFLHDDMWYVLVKDETMFRARLHRYTSEGQFIDILPLPDTGMVMAMEKHANAIVLPDFRLDRLIRIGLNGEPMEDLSSPDWERYQQSLDEENQQSLLVGFALWGLFALLLIAGFVIAIRQQVKNPASKELPDTFAQAAPTMPPAADDPNIHWLKRSRIQEILLALLAAMLIALLALSIFEMATAASECKFRMMSLMLYTAIGLTLLVGVPMLFQLRKSRATKLGVRDEWVVVQRPDGTLARSRATDLYCAHNSLLFVEQHPVLLGPRNNRLFKKGDFERHLEPLLAHAQQLRGLNIYRWRWRYARATVVAEIIIVIAAVTLFYGVYFTDINLIEQALDSYLKVCENKE